MNQLIIIKIECGKDWKRVFNMSTLVSGERDIVKTICNIQKEDVKDSTNNIEFIFDLVDFPRVSEMINAFIEMGVIGEEPEKVEEESQDD